MKPQATNATSPTIGVDEAAEILRCSVRAVQNLIDRSELPALEINQRSTVLLREDVIEYVRIHSRRRSQERKVEDARSKAKLQPVVPVERRRPGRKRRPFIDLDKYEALLTTSAQNA